MIRRIIFTLVVYALCTFTCTASAAKAKVDFNGDGLADAFLHNIFNGDISAVFSGGSSAMGSASYGTLSVQDGWLPIALSDFNGDARSDILLRNTQTGEVSVALVDGGSIVDVTSFGAIDPNSGWLPIDVSDYDGNRRADVLWRNSSTGELFLLNPAGQSWSPPTVPPSSGFLPVAFGDMNGDGSTDILWRNGSTGQLAVWLIYGTSLSVELIITIDPASNWAPITLNDFSGDGRADLMLRNSQTGELYLLVMNGSHIVSDGALPTVDPRAPFAPIGLSDFNGDGSTDMLWRNATSGELYVWLMKGIQYPQVAQIGTLAANSGWFVIGTDDFNGDRRGDILFRNAYSDELLVWYMNGASHQQSLFTDLPASSVWQVQMPR